MASVSALACSAASEELVTDESSNDIIGGTDALSADYNAVGQLVFRSPTGMSNCTGALIAPSVVLTAKHCVMDDPTKEGSPTRLSQGRVYFLIGPDARRPIGGAEVDSVEVAPLFRGGFTGLGSDVAIYRLKTPITTVPPLPVTTKAFSAADVGTSFIAIGYGRQEGGHSGTRKIGAVRLAAITGQPSHFGYDSFDDFLATYDAAIPGTLTEEQKQGLRKRYDQPLSNDYEAYLGRADAQGEVQPCHGDSGGPLLRRENGKLVIYAVVSTAAEPGNSCTRGTMYAAFGASTRELIARSIGDHCEADATTGKLTCGLAAAPASCGMLAGDGATEPTPYVQCLGNSCCAEASACFGDSECSALSNCFRDCSAAGTDEATTQACSNACYQARAGSYAQYLAYTTCAKKNCATP